MSARSAESSRSRRDSNPYRSISRERSAFWRDSLKVRADGHGLANRLHLGGQCRVRLGELLEGEARELHDHVVDGRLERRRRCLGDVVRDLVQGEADGKLCSDLRDGKTRGLRSQRGAARNAGVHLDDDHPAGVRIDAELDVRTARVHADLAYDLERGIAHKLVFLVGKRLSRRDRDAVSRMDAHGVEVLDRADDDHIVPGIPHHFELVLLPAHHRFLDQHLMHGACLQAAGDQFGELLAVVSDAAAGAAQGEGGPEDGREADLFQDLVGLVHAWSRTRSSEPQGRCVPWLS